MISFFKRFIERIPSSLLAAVACLLWATAFVGVKTGLQYSDPISFAGIRFFLAGIILLPFCGSPRKILRILIEFKQVIVIVSLLQTVLLYSFFFLSMNMVEASTGAIVNGVSPLVGAVLAHFFLSSQGNKLTIQKIISFLVALTGIVFITIGKGDLTTIGGRQEITGILFMLSGSICGAFSSIYIARRKAPISPIVLNSLQLSLGGFTLFCISLFGGSFTGEVFLNPQWEFFAALIYLAFLSASAFSIWFYLLKDRAVPVTTLSIWKFIIPVGGAIFSWVLIPGESPDMISLIGMGTTGLAIILFFHKKSTRS